MPKKAALNLYLLQIFVLIIQLNIFVSLYPKSARYPYVTQCAGPGLGGGDPPKVLNESGLRGVDGITNWCRSQTDGWFGICASTRQWFLLMLGGWGMMIRCRKKEQNGKFPKEPILQELALKTEVTQKRYLSPQLKWLSLTSVFLCQSW